jgi:hypothetical protein
VPTRNRLVRLGRTVRLVDDDALTPASLDGVDLAILSSSVVPTKVPSWLASVRIPILDAEAYAQKTLLLASTGGEQAGGTALRIAQPSHPLAAGRSGDVGVQASAPIGSGTPAPGASIIARLPGAASASIYGIEAGAALTSGTAPARRVGFFFSYDSPPKLTAAGWSLFDAAVQWLTPASAPPPPPPPPPAGDWTEPALHHRLPLTIGASNAVRVDRPVVVPVDFGPALAGRGAFDAATVRVVEVDSAGAVLDAAVPFQLDLLTDGDTGELVVLLKGTTAAGATRRFQVYFDAIGTGVAPATVTPRLTTTDGVVDAGQTSVRIATEAGTWFLHEQGGGFSSLIDSAGNDWLSYSTTAGSAGAYRGIPNAVHPEGHFHPGSTTATTQILARGPLRVVLVSTTNDGRWQLRDDVYPRTVTMTMTRAAAPYWFLYEGTPGGQIDQTTDVVIRGNGSQTALNQSWTGDLAGEEWTAFADTARGRSLFLAQQTQDASTDSYWLMESNMTVFGFGRDGLNKYLTGTRSMTVGLVDATTHAALAPRVQDAIRPPVTTLGAAQTKP